MKKKITLMISTLSLVMLMCTPVKADSGWDYKSDVSLDRIDGRWYMRTDCLDLIGDDCNTKNSSSRIDVTPIWEAVLALISIKPF